MTKLHTAIVFSTLALAAAACSKANGAPKGEPCDAKAISELDKTLDSANGIGVDLSDKGLEKEREATKAKITGKRYAFTGCTFSMQGNDQVTFGAKGTDATLDCTMKGGEKGVTEFRRAAMKLDMDKLKLDVSGVIAMGGTKGFERLGLTECSISVHE